MGEWSVEEFSSGGGGAVTYDPQALHPNFLPVMWLSDYTMNVLVNSFIDACCYVIYVQKYRELESFFIYSKQSWTVTFQSAPAQDAQWVTNLLTGNWIKFSNDSSS